MQIYWKRAEGITDDDCLVVGSGAVAKLVVRSDVSLCQFNFVQQRIISVLSRILFYPHPSRTPLLVCLSRSSRAHNSDHYWHEHRH